MCLELIFEQPHINNTNLIVPIQELMDFLNKAPIAMHWLSGTGHVLWANETELNVLGYTAEEYIGQARPAPAPTSA